MRRADGIRTVSPRTSELVQRAIGQEPLASFPAFIDFESFVSAAPKPLPPRRIGRLDRRARKAEGPAAPRRRVATGCQHVPCGETGRGRTRIDAGSHRWPGERAARTGSGDPWLEPPEVAGLLDASTVLALSSRSEGLPRVVMEAFLRGRPVVSPAVGGVPDLVASGHNGLLVEAGDPDGLAQALVRVLSDRALAEQLARGASEAAQRSEWSPAGDAAALRTLVDRVLDLK